MSTTVLLMTYFARRHHIYIWNVDTNAPNVSICQIVFQCLNISNEKSNVILRIAFIRSTLRDQFTS